MENIEDILNSPTLRAPEKHADVILRESQFRLFGKLFKFSIIKEAVETPSIFACDEQLCSTDAVMKRIKERELTPEQIQEMYKPENRSQKRFNGEDSIK